MIRNQHWRTQAACAGHSPSLWFPEGSGNAHGPATQRALAICRSCPVSADCLDHALTQPEHHGIWGGLTETERGLLTGRIRCGTTAGYARHRANGSEPCRSCRDATNAYKRRTWAAKKATG